MTDTIPIHFSTRLSVYRGKTVSHFLEQPSPMLPKDRPYRRGKHPVEYIYNHETGCMRMKHPDLYSTREIMARSESALAKGAKPAVRNDATKAFLIAANHLRAYVPDGMDHSERQLHRRTSITTAELANRFPRPVND